MRKSVTKTWAFDGYCRRCKKFFKPENFCANGRPQRFGYGFKTWIVYQRVVNRLPYGRIRESIKDLFHEDITDKMLIIYIRDIAKIYSSTEEIIIQKLLMSPSLHVDETQLNIDNINQYIWVFTNRQYVIFRHTETRESAFVKDFLKQYTGILISDFYKGYDAIECKHQKCLVHLIRDLNNDLWANPFDGEFGVFVNDVKELMFPIMTAIQEYGLKKRHLNRFQKQVDKFLIKKIDHQKYNSDLACKYQKRFSRYRDNLFTFLKYDNIFWHNNPAEHALRHVILQSDISRQFHKTMIKEYLLLLGIRQTCKFQNKSFLEFLLSNEKDVDNIKNCRLRISNTRH